MRAVVMRGKELVLDEVPEPVPAAGEVLVRTEACGICGTDLHMLKTGLVPGDVVMGHEFCAEVLEASEGLAAGTRVVAMPFMGDTPASATVGFVPEYPGGYGERMVLKRSNCFEVPNGLSAERAALTEPMAVGGHAVARARMQPGEAAIVTGCGPVGLAVIGGLALAGVEPIVASDLSPLRRRLAEGMGAHRVVDPREQPVADAWQELAAARPGGEVVLFEAVGVPGMIQELIEAAPPGSRIVVVGLCMEPDRFMPGTALAKELSLEFVLAYTAGEFEATLRAVAEGRLDVEPLITGRVGLDGVARAFDDLGQPDVHAKILVDPNAP